MRLRNRDEFLISTPLDPMAALGTLRGRTAAHGEGRSLFTGDIPYGGGVFTVSPMGFGRNSWRPILRGEVRETAGGSEVRVTARCWWFTRAFMTVWYGGLGLITATAVVRWIAAGTPPPGILALFWAFGWCLPHFAFWGPENRARADLCRIWQGELTEL